MKRSIVSIVLMMSAWLMFVCADVGADMIMEPNDGGFYEEHMSECRYIDYRYYYVPSDRDVYTDPTMKEKVSSVAAGEKRMICVEYTDENGDLWGCMPTWSEMGFDSWVRMDGMQVIYDNFSFMEEHRSELELYDGELESFVPENQVVMWNYPGAERINEIVEAKYWFTENYGPPLDQQAKYVYNDSNGNKWVYVSYMPQGWVYLPDPESELVHETAASREETQTQTVSEAVQPETEAEQIISEEIDAISEEAQTVSEERAAVSVTAAAAVTELTQPAVMTEVTVEITAERTSSDIYGFIEDIPEEREIVRKTNPADMRLPFILAGAAAVISCILIIILKKRG